MTRTGGRLLVDCLLEQGVDTAFGVPGESYLTVLDTFHDVDDRLHFVTCRQEGGAAYMAEAWARFTGRVGVCFVTRGPGATNASIGVHTAMQDSVPMILLVGQIGTEMREREAFQEVNYRAVFGTMAKWVTEIDDVSRVPEILSRAWTTATTGRPGPVVIALPEDMLMAETEAAPVVGPAATPVVASRHCSLLAATPAVDSTRPTWCAGIAAAQPDDATFIRDLPKAKAEIPP